MWFYANVLTPGWEWSMYSRLNQLFFLCLNSIKCCQIWLSSALNIIYPGIKRLDVACWFTDVTVGFSVKKLTNSIKWFVPLFFVRTHGGSILCEIVGYSSYGQNAWCLKIFYINIIILNVSFTSFFTSLTTRVFQVYLFLFYSSE